jgi:hypothetical protein
MKSAIKDAVDSRVRDRLYSPHYISDSIHVLLNSVAPFVTSVEVYVVTRLDTSDATYDATSAASYAVTTLAFADYL